MIKKSKTVVFYIYCDKMNMEYNREIKIRKVEDFMKLCDMTLEQKIGHLICARGFNSEEDKEYIIDMAKKGCIGGIQMWNKPGYKEFIDKVRENAGYPILVCADMENGYRGGKYSYPPSIGLAASDDPSLAYKMARVTAIEAKKDGVNVAWGPVVDLAVEGALCRVPRCFSDDFNVISEYAVEMIKAFQDEGMVVTAKHFPGTIDRRGDSHMKREVSKMTKQDILDSVIIPYREAMKKANLSGIMTGHSYCTEIDDKYIGSLSKKTIDIIRDEGFDGIIMTDSLAMMAIVQNYGEKESLGLAIAAGNDMVLPNYRLSFKDSYEYLLSAYKEGVFSEERLNDAVRHVLEAQEKTLKKPSMDEVSQELIDAVEEADRKSICVITKDGITGKLSENTKKLFVLLCQNSYPDISGESRELGNKRLYKRSTVEKHKEELLKLFPGSDAYIINEFPHFTETETVCKKVSECDEAIFFTFCQSGSYIASDSITERMKNIIDANKEKISTIVHIGNPYEIKKFDGIGRIINAPLGGNPEKHIYKILKGELSQKGKIPVKI